MNILIFLDELYSKDGSFYYSKFNAGRFLYNLKDIYSLKFAVPVSKNKQISYSTKIEENLVIDLGEWDSLIGYLKSYFKNTKNIKNILVNEIKNADKVWLRFPSIPGLIIAKMCIKENTPMIIHVAGDISKAYESEKYTGTKKLLAYVLGKYMHYKTYKIMINKKAEVTFLCTGSKLEKDFYKSNTQFFIDNEINKIKKIRNELDKLSFLYVGRLVEEKGIKLLIESWNKVGKDIDLNIVGYGDLESYVINASNYNRNIKYHGFKQGSELDEIYKKCDCLIMPSINSEGFPRVIAEAWCKGLCVISSDVGGIKGIAKDKKNILFFETGNESSLINTINLIIDNENIYNDLLNNIDEVAEFISRDNMLDIVKKNIE